ncbi:hypothetical protein LSTR_LSTR001008 [Laodelphax striatellus]|uniref:C2H2-type domain-containing protein n=1 Tax=Laodelphax striatellus TaxID=195883 RepID=A0A482X0U7_LAOST|nr:hypothetical protein LSTR_LSTR001008 [Laodelphax striatellus]
MKARRRKYSLREGISRRLGVRWVASDAPEVEMYTCAKCSKTYRLQNSLYKHQQFDCGKEPRFSCPHCPFKTKRKENLRGHVLTRHFPLQELM